MNAADFLNNKHNSNNINSNAADFLNDVGKPKKQSNKIINDTVRKFNDNTNVKSIKSEITIDDVLYNEYDADKKIIIINKDNKEKKTINKKNKKLFKLFIEQEAERINDSRF